MVLPPRGKDTIMIVMATAGVALIFLLAGVVRVLDAVRAERWRRVAAQRRQNWEARQAAPVEPLTFEAARP
jgi:hypothetical protein